jgi:hypothetical protein
MHANHRLKQGEADTPAIVLPCPWNYCSRQSVASTVFMACPSLPIVEGYHLGLKRSW